MFSSEKVCEINLCV